MRLLSTALTGAFLLTSALHAQPTGAVAEQVRFSACLDRVERDADDALEEAQTWRMQGGGWPARHCEALSLIALGEMEVGAAILDDLAIIPRPGNSQATRLAQLVAAGEAWSRAGRSEEAVASYSTGLTLAPENPHLLIARAKANLDLGDWQALNRDAEILVDTAPYLAESWSMRAQARLEGGDREAALADIEEARMRAPEDIDILVLRGRILEARRLAGES